MTRVNYTQPSFLNWFALNDLGAGFSRVSSGISRSIEGVNGLASRNPILFAIGASVLGISLMGALSVYGAPLGNRLSGIVETVQNKVWRTWHRNGTSDRLFHHQFQELKPAGGVEAFLDQQRIIEGKDLFHWIDEKEWLIRTDILEWIEQTPEITNDDLIELISTAHDENLPPLPDRASCITFIDNSLKVRQAKMLDLLRNRVPEHKAWAKIFEKHGLGTESQRWEWAKEHFFGSYSHYEYIQNECHLAYVLGGTMLNQTVSDDGQFFDVGEWNQLGILSGMLGAHAGLTVGAGSMLWQRVAAKVANPLSPFNYIGWVA